MHLFDVYHQYDIEPIIGHHCRLMDNNGYNYLDFYGGHAVVSIGHGHPHFIEMLKDQIDKLVFYSNAVKNELQEELAGKLLEMSGLRNYTLFLCNSGAEANENALKLASFHNGKTKIIALNNGFHGRTSAAVNVTDNQSIQAPINKGFEVELVSINDIDAIQNSLAKGDVCAVIVEAIQGIGGLNQCSVEYLQAVSKLCKEHNAILICDEVQCGYGRSGDFFAYQWAGIRPGLVTMAKGMGNGIPIGGVLIDSEVFQSKKGLLGTTFGGNHLAMAAGIAVLDVLKDEELMTNAREVGKYLEKGLGQLPGVVSVKGRGLMIGVEYGFDTKQLRNQLLFEKKIFVGSSNNPNQIRLLPPLTITKVDVDELLEALIELNTQN